MPRKHFLADLKAAQNAPLPEGLYSLQAGADDGQLEFSFKSVDLDIIDITAIVTDVSEYPDNHEFMIFCSDEAAPQLAARLQTICNTDRKSVAQLLDLVAVELSGTRIDNSQDLEGDFDDFDDDDESFLTGAPMQPQSMREDRAQTVQSKQANISQATRDRIRSDLLAVKDAGFRVGVIGDLLGGANAFIVISIRISKLGISDEALLAWQLEPKEYLSVLIYYPSGYHTNEQLQGSDSMTLKTLCVMRVFASTRYKPTLHEAIAACQDLPVGEEAPTTQTVRPTFLSRPLLRLLNEELITILRIRATGMDWAGAEAWHRDREGARTLSEEIPESYYQPEVLESSFPAIVAADEYNNRESTKHSFPLIAMQFTLRHFVRCVEFCLVCHRKTNNKLEAIKPYVCNRPLCLFQFMAMGFGPSIEHEIMSQPYVVDLLVSFCYSAAINYKLQEKDLPTGLGMRAPNTKGLGSKDVLHGWPSQTKDHETDAEEIDIGFDRERLEIQFLDQREGGSPVSRGQWIMIRIAHGRNGISSNEILHCRVSETAFFPTIKIETPIATKTDRHINASTQQQSGGTATPSMSPKWIPCVIRRHDQEFDDMTREQKCDAICQLLDILPSLEDMQAYLRRSNTHELKRWTERVPPAAYQLLQWIIASNRACIMQVNDNIPGHQLQGSAGRRQERVQGMPEHLQFRFAMGAPDKEERFLSEVCKTQRRLKLAHPTIFAWHGSPLHNWHMIIREGLHFKNADHGRAYGDGVYHAKDARTSAGYSNFHAVGALCWPNSVLKVKSAVALNELVNAPTEFQSSNPYYVVQQLDWIQTRYLLVQCDIGSVASLETRAAMVAHPQDPVRTPTGVNSMPIIIPASAIKSGRRKSKAEEKRKGEAPIKRQKGNSGEPIVIDSDEDSEATDEEDAALLRNDTAAGVADQCANITLSDEDFIPELDLNSLPLMPLPTYATSGTTRRLMKELQSLQGSIDSTPTRELGWYIDTGRVDNVYQWIVELHSFHTFEPRLPLADDMKRKKIKSVVLEIRFGSDFPFSPPYIRVVRPRFLSLAQGGGGHIVIGGAMCMELLTNTGWSGISSMESVLMQVRLAVASEPFARLDDRARGDYGVAEAADGYIRACNAHGWAVPPGFRDIAYGMNDI